MIDAPDRPVDGQDFSQLNAAQQDLLKAAAHRANIHVLDEPEPAEPDISGTVQQG